MHAPASTYPIPSGLDLGELQHQSHESSVIGAGILSLFHPNNPALDGTCIPHYLPLINEVGLKFGLGRSWIFSS